MAASSLSSAACFTPRGHPHHRHGATATVRFPIVPTRRRSTSPLSFSSSSSLGLLAVLLLCSLSLLSLCFVLSFSHRHSNCSGERPSSCASRRCSPSRGFCYQNSGPSFRRGKSFLLSSGHRLTRSR